MMRKLWAALCALALACAPALAADNNFGTSGGSTAPGAVAMCLNGSSQAVPCSNSTPLQVGGSLALAGSTSNASDGVATSATNLPAVVYLYGWNGASFDRLQVDASKNLKTVVNAALPAGTNILGKVGIDQTTPGTTNGVQINAALPAGTNVIGLVRPDQTTPGTTNGINFTTSSNSGVGLVPGVAGSSVSSLVLKASAGNLYRVYATCTSACWLMVFNATSLPGNGATTAGIASGNLQECVPIPANGVGTIDKGAIPEVFANGITAAISSTSCGTLTASTVGFINGDVK